MNKLTLLAIATQPKYDDNDQWTGAEISADIEAEVEDGEQKGLHRVGIKFEISKTLALAVSVYGFRDDDTNIFEKRIEACLLACTKKWPGTQRDARTIYEVMRLKLPRFVVKAAHHIYYVQNFRNGEIDECTEYTIDRKIK